MNATKNHATRWVDVFTYGLGEPPVSTRGLCSCGWEITYHGPESRRLARIALGEHVANENGSDSVGGGRREDAR